jgi:hypothetical protein
MTFEGRPRREILDVVDDLIPAGLQYASGEGRLA